jgi:hypothetical protein
MQIAAGQPQVKTATAAHPVHGGWVEVVVLGAFAAELALLIGERGSIAGIILASISAAFWWHGYGRAHDAADPIALGNAAGILIGLSIGYPQLLIPAAIAVPVVLLTGSLRMWQLGQRREFAYLLATTLIAAAGSAWLALNLHLLPR